MRKRIRDWLKGAGKLRDGFLVTAGIFYFFGYVVWAIHAYRNDLGLLPALDFQYFVAGMPNVLVLLGLYGIFVGFKTLRETVQGWIGTNPRGGKLLVYRAMIGLGMGAVLLIYIHPAEWFKHALPGLADSSWLVFLLGLLIIVSTFFIPKQSDKAVKRPPKNNRLRELVDGLSLVPIGFLQLLGRLYAPMFFIGLAALAFIYVVELYPKIPQEFGGALPRYACLDVVKGQLSKETVADILSDDANKSAQPVVRSLRVEVFFSGSEVILVRSQGRVYEITKSVIHTINACD